LKICREGIEIEDERGRKKEKKMIVDAKLNIFW
jgi:hypothetical protein